MTLSGLQLVIIILLMVMVMMDMLIFMLLMVKTRCNSSFCRHVVENGLCVLEQVAGGVKLLEPAGVQHHDLVRVHDGVDPVGDGEDGALPELLPDGGLDEAVRLKVHGGGGLVQHVDPGVPQQGPRQAHQLSLTLRQVFTALLHLQEWEIYMYSK